METKVETLEGNRVKVTVTIDADAIGQAIKKQYRLVSSKYNIPGFRPGKAPRKVIDSALGKDYVLAVVTDELVNDAYPKALAETAIYPVGQPEFGDEEMGLVEDGKPYTFVFEVDVKPTMELTSYDPVAIEMPPAKATDEQIDEEISTILQHYSETTDAPANTKVKPDSSVRINMSAKDDKGESIESLDKQDLTYNLGGGFFPPTFDEALVGMKKGETKEFTIDMPSESYVMTSLLAGKTSTIAFSVEVLAVLKKVEPKLTDEWVKEKLGLESVDELRKEITEEIDAQLESVMPRLKEARVLAALQERLSEEPPAAVVEDQEATLLQDFFTQLQRQGLTLDAYLKSQGITQEQFRDDVKLQAMDLAKQDLALDAYAAHKAMEVTDADILNEFEKAGAENPADLMEDWIEKGQIHLIRQGILRERAVNEIMEAAKVTEKAATSSKKGSSKKKDDE